VALWLNGERVLLRTEPVKKGKAEDRIVLRCHSGENHLLIRVMATNGSAEFSLFPLLPLRLQRSFEARLQRDFPRH
jgi:hypothetical protein